MTSMTQSGDAVGHILSARVLRPCKYPVPPRRCGPNEGPGGRQPCYVRQGKYTTTHGASCLRESVSTASAVRRSRAAPERVVDRLRVRTAASDDGRGGERGAQGGGGGCPR